MLLYGSISGRDGLPRTTREKLTTPMGDGPASYQSATISSTVLKPSPGPCRLRHHGFGWPPEILDVDRPVAYGDDHLRLGYALEKRGFTDDPAWVSIAGGWIESDVWTHEGDYALDPEGARFPYNGYIGPAMVKDGRETGMAYSKPSSRVVCSLRLPWQMDQCR